MQSKALPPPCCQSGGVAATRSLPGGRKCVCSASRIVSCDIACRIAVKAAGCDVRKGMSLHNRKCWLKIYLVPHRHAQPCKQAVSEQSERPQPFRLPWNARVAASCEVRIALQGKVQAAGALSQGGTGAAWSPRSNAHKVLGVSPAAPLPHSLEDFVLKAREICHRCPRRGRAGAQERPSGRGSPHPESPGRDVQHFAWSCMLAPASDIPPSLVEVLQPDSSIGS